MSGIAVLVALPATAVALLALLRSTLAARLVGATLAVGGVHGSKELFGILGGCAIVFLAGLVDDARSLPPVAKLGSQLAAAALVLSTGLQVQIVGNDVLATALALLWLVGMTNAFNLLDNMDGLAASLAGIASVLFAVDAVTEHPS